MMRDWLIFVFIQQVVLTGDGPSQCRSPVGSVRSQKMLRDSIQSVLDDELSYVAFATVNLYRKERNGTDEENPVVNSCYVCLGGWRIYLFAKDLSDKCESKLYLSYKRLSALIRSYNYCVWLFGWKIHNLEYCDTINYSPNIHTGIHVTTMTPDVMQTYAGYMLFSRWTRRSFAVCRQ